MEYKSIEEAFNAGYEKAKQDMLNALNKDKKAYDKKESETNYPTGYTSKVYKVNDKTVTRINPDYDAGQCFTLIKCEDCGEWYEAGRLHICKIQNSYSVIN